jgi:hypothetical protein
VAGRVGAKLTRGRTESPYGMSGRPGARSMMKRWIQNPANGAARVTLAVSARAGRPCTLLINAYTQASSRIPGGTRPACAAGRRVTATGAVPAGDGGPGSADAAMYRPIRSRHGSAIARTGGDRGRPTGVARPRCCRWRVRLAAAARADGDRQLPRGRHAGAQGARFSIARAPPGRACQRYGVPRNGGGRPRCIPLHCRRNWHALQQRHAPARIENAGARPSKASRAEYPAQRQCGQQRESAVPPASPIHAGAAADASQVVPGVMPGSAAR